MQFVLDRSIYRRLLVSAVYIPFDVQRMSDSVSINVRVADRMKDPSLGAVLWSATVRQLECSEKAFLLQYDKFLGKFPFFFFSYSSKTKAIDSLPYIHITHLLFISKKHPLAVYNTSMSAVG